MPRTKEVKWKYFWVVVRVFIGFVFLWAFLDKLFGFGMATAPGKAWINGVSPTAGFLSHATQGPFASIFQSLASSNLVAWLFMIGLFLVGITMILGVLMNLSAITGCVMLFLMWLSLLPPANNPFIDEHWFEAFALIAATITKSGNHFGFGKWWSKRKFVKKMPFFE
jgi:thiosulfate dehydrogenase [quinone] large subunit